MKLSTFNFLLTLGTVLAPTATIAMPTPMDAERAKHYAELERRQGPASIAEIAAGIFVEIIAEGIGGSAVSDVANAIATALNPGGPKAPWDNGDNCHVSFRTQGGENCYAQTYAASASGNSSTDANTHDNNWNVCPWVNPGSTAPPVQYFTDPGIGDFSVRHTATDTVAWIDPSMGSSGKSVQCVAQGLCNPQFVFYRGSYNLVINSWQTQNPYYGGYTDEWAGLCTSGVLNQFSKGGDVLGGKCAIPCWNQAELPDGHSS